MTKPKQGRQEMEMYEISIVGRCNLLEICGSTLYYEGKAQESELIIDLMAELDIQDQKTPFYGKYRTEEKAELSVMCG